VSWPQWQDHTCHRLRHYLILLILVCISTGCHFLLECRLQSKLLNSRMSDCQALMHLFVKS
jgi:hypothetical protein